MIFECIAYQFEQQALRAPHSIAVIALPFREDEEKTNNNNFTTNININSTNEEVLTYSELNIKANQLSTFLISSYGISNIQ